ncbi:MAG: HAMP domain-containing histidine kinase [Clostridia bacterium]|nr:HAMP domain-containing histidine kinase [Clostridia bacterium]
MIQKLKRKFILVNMLFVIIVLIATFVGLYISTSRRLASDGIMSMERTLNQAMDFEPPRNEIGGKKPDKNSPSPVVSFCVQLDENGNINKIFGDHIVFSNDFVMDDVVKYCLDTKQTSGIVKEQNLRFLVRSFPDGTKIAFADRSGEIRTLRTLVKNSLLVGMGSIIIFFFLSFFLAKLALKPVEKAWAQQKQFVGDASHELKTPLTVILANAGIVLSHRSDTVANQAKWIEYIQTEANRMTALVNDLLFLAKADDAKLDVVLSTINLSDIVWSSVLPFESVAFEQKKTLKTDIQPDIYINGDENKLKQLIVILLDNACKHSDKKGIITLKLKASQDKVKLSVTNTGTPIPQDQIPHIFERFYRVDKSRARENGGYGLGLAIAKSIVDALCGKISVQSSELEGTVFTITFPAVKNKF